MKLTKFSKSHEFVRELCGANASILYSHLTYLEREWGFGFWASDPLLARHLKLTVKQIRLAKQKLRSAGLIVVTITRKIYSFISSYAIRPLDKFIPLYHQPKRAGAPAQKGRYIDIKNIDNNMHAICLKNDSDSPSDVDVCVSDNKYRTREKEEDKGGVQSVPTLSEKKEEGREEQEGQVRISNTTPKTTEVKKQLPPSWEPYVEPAAPPQPTLMSAIIQKFGIGGKKYGSEIEEQLANYGIHDKVIAEMVKKHGLDKIGFVIGDMKEDPTIKNMGAALYARLIKDIEPNRESYKERKEDTRHYPIKEKKYNPYGSHNEDNGHSSCESSVNEPYSASFKLFEDDRAGYVPPSKETMSKIMAGLKNALAIP